MTGVLLEGLDDVDWKNYTHAYGSAEAVPGLLRAWLSHDNRDPDDVSDVPDLMFAGGSQETVSTQAFADLMVSVFHQGDVHTAAGPLAGFLLRIARDGDHEDKFQALHMLGTTLAGGRRNYSEADGFDPQAHEDPEVYVAAADVDVLLSIVNSDADIDVRIMAVNLLAWLPAAAEEIGEVLRTRLDGPDGDIPELASHMLLALAMAARQCGSSVDLDRFFFFEPAGMGFPVVNALALARIREVDVPGPVFDLLRESLSKSSPFPFSNHDFPGPLDEGFVHLLADAIINSLLHPRSGEPDEALWQECLVDIEGAFSQHGRSRLNSLLSFHRSDRATRPTHVRRIGTTAADPARDSEDRFHTLAPSAGIQRAIATPITAEVIGLLGFGGRRVRLVSLDSLRVIGTLVTDIDSNAPPVFGRCDTTRLAPEQASTRGFIKPRVSLLNVAASSDGRWLAAGGVGRVFVWNLSRTHNLSSRSGPVAVLEGFAQTRVDFAWSPQGDQLAAVAGRRTHIWRAGEWETPEDVLESSNLMSIGWKVSNAAAGRDPDQPAVIHSGDGSTSARLYSLEGDDEAILWMADADPASGGPGLIHTNRPENLILYRWVRHDRPMVLGEKERKQYFETVQKREAIRSRLAER